MSLHLSDQDDRPEYPNDLSPDMKDFLAICFNKDPQKRPSARGLLRHKWVQYHRATLRNSWSRTQGLRSRGQRPSAAHTKVSVVVDRILQVAPSLSNDFLSSIAVRSKKTLSSAWCCYRQHHQTCPYFFVGRAFLD